MSSPLTLEAARAEIFRHGAVYRGTRNGIQWYWSTTEQRWFGLYAVVGGYAVKVATKESCNC